VSGERPRAVDAGLVLALTLLAAAMGPLAALIIDSGRDLASAYAVAQGLEFPAYGPGLFGTWKPGPVWFYLLAVPLAVTGSIGATAGFAGLLAAMKIPLAFALGRRARGVAAGLAFAACVALPGWSTLGQLVLSHTMLVEAGVLATLLLAWLAGTRASGLLLACAALLLALAVHAHPTALVAAPAVAWAAWRVLRERPVGRAGGSSRGWAWLALAAAAFVLPFAPALVAEARSGWPQLAGTAAYAMGGDYLARLDRFDEVLRGATFGQAAFVRDFLLARWAPLGWLAWTLGLAVTFAALVGAAVAVARDRLVAAVFALAGAGWLFVLLLRDATPAWMVYALAPLDAALLALGWVALFPARWKLPAARAIAGLAIVASAGLLAERLLVVRDGTQYLPTASVADIAVPPARDPPVRFWMPAPAHDALFARACGLPGAVSLHGDLAAALHFGQGVAAALHCPPGQAAFGGQAPRTLAGVPRTLARDLGIAGEPTAWGFVLATPVRVVHPAQPRPYATHTRYLLDDYLPRVGRDAPARVSVHTACAPDDVLAITDLVPGLNEPFEARFRHTPAPLLGQTIATRYFACPPEAQWSLEVIALDADAVGIAVLRRG